MHYPLKAMPFNDTNMQKIKLFYTFVYILIIIGVLCMVMNKLNCNGGSQETVKKVYSLRINQYMAKKTLWDSSSFHIHILVEL